MNTTNLKHNIYIQTETNVRIDPILRPTVTAAKQVKENRGMVRKKDTV